MMLLAQMEALALDSRSLVESAENTKADLRKLEARRDLEVRRLAESVERVEGLHESLAKEYSFLQERF